MGWGESKAARREKLGEAAACKGEGIGSRNGLEWGSGSGNAVKAALIDGPVVAR